MCFAPQVDVVVGLGVSVIAVDALRHSPDARTIPIALLPAVFAVHTLSEAFIWWGADGTVSPTVAKAATDLYVLIAFVLLPVLVPAAVAVIEPPGRRRVAMLVPLAAGVSVAGIYLSTILGGDAQAVVCDYYIDYRMIGSPTLSGLLYSIAACVPLLLSSHRELRAWGVANAVVLGGLAIWAARAMPSLWCIWAAITSLFVAWLLRSQRAFTEESPALPVRFGQRAR